LNYVPVPYLTEYDTDLVDHRFDPRLSNHTTIYVDRPVPYPVNNSHGYGFDAIINVGVDAEGNVVMKTPVVKKIHGSQTSGN